MKNNHKVENAIIMAAGKSTRFSPLSYEYPKALVEVKGEILIERQIRQLKEAGIDDITVVVGYKKEQFVYLQKKFNVDIVENPEYDVRNNSSSLYHVKEKLSNTYICSADNYFKENVFESHVEKAYYSAVYVEGESDEWCLTVDDTGLIKDAVVGCIDSWIMLGHVYFDEEFSNQFVNILESIYDLEDTKSKFWEDIYIENIDILNLYIKKYPDNIIFEFDSLDELRDFDQSYNEDTRSKILKNIANQLDTEEKYLTKLIPILKSGDSIGFEFVKDNNEYQYYYRNKNIVKKTVEA